MTNPASDADIRTMSEQYDSTSAELGRKNGPFSDEMWDLLDVDNRPTGRVVARATIGNPEGNLQPGDRHRCVSCCVFSPDGRLLIQQRTNDKAGWPGYWDITAGGSALAGETSQEAMARELFEEVGITHDFTGISPMITQNRASGPFDFYIIEADLDPSTLVLQATEVQAVQWATRDEIDTLIAEDRFVMRGTFVALVFDLHIHADIEIPYVWQ